MTERGRWGAFPGDCGGEAEAMFGFVDGAGQRRKGRAWNDSGGPSQALRGRKAVSCKPNERSVLDQRDEDRPLEEPNGIPSRSLVGFLAVHVAGELYQRSPGYKSRGGGGNENAAVSRERVSTNGNADVATGDWRQDQAGEGENANAGTSTGTGTGTDAGSDVVLNCACAVVCEERVACGPSWGQVGSGCRWCLFDYEARWRNG